MVSVINTSQVMANFMKDPVYMTKLIKFIMLYCLVEQLSLTFHLSVSLDSQFCVQQLITLYKTVLLDLY